MSSFADQLRLYDYAFSPDRIAQAPASPRDSARLLVFDRKSKKTDWSTFRHIGDYLPANSLLVLNRTKVIPAKLLMTRSTGGAVSALSLGAERGCIRVMANRRLTIGEWLTLDGKKGFTVKEQQERFWLLEPSFPLAQLQSVFSRFGHMPLPPYIKHTPLTPAQLRRQYQSVFARDPGSIAAPTASLHFTKALLKKLQARGIRIAYVTLHVHLGTFAPLTEEQWKEGLLHEEEYHIDSKTAAAIEKAKDAGNPVIAVGTTVVRTLESASDRSGHITQPYGTTKLFIREGYRFKNIDGMITNFHVPKSSLLMLVSAFTGRETLLDLYRQAMEKDFRFFSFGDGMLLL